MARQLLWMALAVAFAGCGESTPAPEIKIQVHPMDPLVQGETRRIQFENEALTGSQWKWVSADAKIAAVSANGDVEGKVAGSTVIVGRQAKRTVRIPIAVSVARRAWTAPLPLGRKTFLAVAAEGSVFAKTVQDEACDWLCFGELFVLDSAGKQRADWQGVRRVIAAQDRAWIEGNGAMFTYDYAKAVSAPAPVTGNLLAVFANGDPLLSNGNYLVRYTADGEEVGRWDAEGSVQHAVLQGEEIIAAAGRRLFLLREGGKVSLPVEGPSLPWGANQLGDVLVTDARNVNFAVFESFGATRILSGLYSVLFSPIGLVESEGLSALLSVPVATTPNGRLFIEMHTFGNKGTARSFDVVFRNGDFFAWRWGPSACADHPFAVAAIEGAAFVSSCARITRIDDILMTPVGPWPQPGGDAARSWRTRD